MPNRKGKSLTGLQILMIFNKICINGKMRDKKNGFDFAEKLCDEKIKKLKLLYGNIRKYNKYSSKSISLEVQEVIGPALFEKSAFKKLKELGID